MPHRLDEKDVDIIRELQRNGRIAASELEKDIPGCTRRIKILIEKGYIKPTVLVDRDLISWTWGYFVLVKLTRTGTKHLHEFMTAISRMKEVTECYQITGPYSAILRIDVPDSKLFEPVRRKIADLECVEGNTQTLVVLEIMKCDLLPAEAVLSPRQADQCDQERS